MGKFVLSVAKGTQSRPLSAAPDHYKVFVCCRVNSIRWNRLVHFIMNYLETFDKCIDFSTTKKRLGHVRVLMRTLWNRWRVDYQLGYNRSIIDIYWTRSNVRFRNINFCRNSKLDENVASVSLFMRTSVWISPERAPLPLESQWEWASRGQKFTWGRSLSILIIQVSIWSLGR